MAGNAPAQPTCPLTRVQVIDRYFLEHRAKLLDVAAFLDRLERAEPDAAATGAEDYRNAAMRRALEVLTDEQGDKARRVQEVFSDPTTEPAESAEALGPANGAHHAGPSEPDTVSR